MVWSADHLLRGEGLAVLVVADEPRLGHRMVLVVRHQHVVRAGAHDVVPRARLGRCRQRRLRRTPPDRPLCRRYAAERLAYRKDTEARLRSSAFFACILASQQQSACMFSAAERDLRQ